MTWFGWVFIAVILVSMAATVSSIGEPRKPLIALLALITIDLLIVGAITVGTK